MAPANKLELASIATLVITQMLSSNTAYLVPAIKKLNDINHCFSFGFLAFMNAFCNENREAING